MKFSKGISSNKTDKRLYQIWRMMICRCENPKHIAYKNYGAKGITVCEEWHSFVYFGSWAINNGYSDNLTIDRIDNNGNYEPSNCHWVTMKEQANNKSVGQHINLNGNSISFSVTQRNKKWQYRFTPLVDGKRKSISKCGFKTKEEAIEAAKKSLETKTLICPNKAH